MSFSIDRSYAICLKEIYHILRDPFTLALSLGMPIFLVFVFGFAIEFNVKNIPLAVFDADQSQNSRRLIDTFDSSKYFIVHSVTSPFVALQDLMGNQARAALIIPGGFQKDLFSNRKAKAQILLDGSDNSTVAPILSYVSTIEQIASKRLANFDPAPLIDLKVRYLFNEELNSRWFVLPGLLAVVMAIIAVLLTSLTVAREWENGSMELLLSTPIKPLEIIVGKLIPYAAMGISAVLVIYIISRTVFDVPFRGSPIAFSLGVLLFLLAYLSQGLWISVITRSQPIAMQLAIMSGLLPVQLLSGFIFPIESMPTFFRYLTMILPARWFVSISRESYLKGLSLLEMWLPILILGIYASLMMFLATKTFKKDLEP